MNLATTRWVMFIALFLILPLPFYGDSLVILPLARVSFVVSAEFLLFTSGAGMALTPLVLLALGIGLWSVFLWLLAGAYCQLSSSWPAKVRGSLMSIAVFITLILLASLPVYRGLTVERHALTFLQVYE